MLQMQLQVTTCSSSRASLFAMATELDPSSCSSRSVMVVILRKQTKKHGMLFLWISLPDCFLFLLCLVKVEFEPHQTLKTKTMLLNLIKPVSSSLLLALLSLAEEVGETASLALCNGKKKK